MNRGDTTPVGNRGNDGRPIRVRGYKDVAIRINKSGLLADGTQRYAVAVRFSGDAVKKASKSEYVAMGIHDETNRLYFFTASREDGYKLTPTSKNGVSERKTVTVTVDDVEEWRSYVGDYDLIKDVSDGTYYIDLPPRK